MRWRLLRVGSTTGSASLPLASISVSYHTLQVGKLGACNFAWVPLTRIIFSGVRQAYVPRHTVLHSRSRACLHSTTLTMTYRSGMVASSLSPWFRSPSSSAGKVWSCIRHRCNGEVLHGTAFNKQPRWISGEDYEHHITLEILLSLTQARLASVMMRSTERAHRDEVLISLRKPNVLSTILFLSHHTCHSHGLLSRMSCDDAERRQL
jgi:hypothetical protein